jgi:ubiquinone/menaquinone biosynthesis C-methylase UbiE
MIPTEASKMNTISRVKRPKSAARKTYDRISRFYDLLAGSSETPYMRKGLQMLEIERGESVLEIGTGTGKALMELCQKAGDRGIVCGLDISAGMLEVTRNKLGKANLAERAGLVNGDGAILPFASASFEALFMSFTLELFDTPEIPLVLRECWQVLKPGGRISVVSMLKPEQTSWVVRLYEWFHERLPNYVDCRPIMAGTMLQGAGFIVTGRRVESMWGLPVELVRGRKG